MWDAGTSLTPSEVLQRLDRQLAYTTVMTVLVRLHEKGMLSRARSGRAYGYAAAITRKETGAASMIQLLTRHSDRVLLGGDS